MRARKQSGVNAAAWFYAQPGFRAMTFDDWKTTDDTPEPDPNRCETCHHPEGYCDCLCCNEAPGE